MVSWGERVVIEVCMFRVFFWVKWILGNVSGFKLFLKVYD